MDFFHQHGYFCYLSRLIATGLCRELAGRDEVGVNQCLSEPTAMASRHFSAADIPYPHLYGLLVDFLLVVVD